MGIVNLDKGLSGTNAGASITLPSGEILVGNASDLAAAVAMSGDVTISNTGVTTIKSNVALAGDPTTTTQLSSDNSTKIATTAAARAIAVSIVSGADHARGFYDASTNLFPATGGSGTAGAILFADYWTVSVAGTLGGEPVAIGTVLTALVNTPGQTASNWNTQNSDFVTGPASAVDGAIALFNGTSGKIIKDSAITISTDGTLASNSDSLVSTQKAVKTYADSVSSNASVIAKVLTGFSAGAGAVSSSDSILSAFQKVVGNITALVTGVSSIFGRTGAVTAQSGDYTVGQVTGAEATANKDATGGYAGLTLFKINFKNAANTFTSFFTNSNTAARTYTFQDRDGTIVDNTDLATKQNTITFGTGVQTALGVNVGTAGAPVVNGGALGTPISGTATNITGLPEGGLALTDITTNDVSTSKHGFAPKLPNDSTKFLNGVGAYAVPATTLPAGSVVQMITTQTGAVATGTTVMPTDDTIPQKTEGDEYITLAITPTNASNKLIIEFVGFPSASILVSMAGALFQDTTTDALAAVASTAAGVGYLNPMNLTHSMTAGTTSSTTFRIRIGPASAATITLNGQLGGRWFGGVAATSLKITEIKV